MKFGFPPLRFITYLFCVFSLVACGESSSTGADKPTSTDTTPQRGGRVVFRVSSDPGVIHPLYSSDILADITSSMTFQYLINLDPYTLDRIPQLAEGLPEVSEDKLSYTYTLRKEAKWDDGSPVTARDYAFTLKIILHPDITMPEYADYYTFAETITLDPENDRKFTIKVNKAFFMADIALAGFGVQQEKLLDPAGVLANYSLEEIRSEEVQKATAEFASALDERLKQTEGDHLAGSGAYKIVSHDINQRYRIERKKDWWGDAIKADNWCFQNYPDEIVIEVIPDIQTAVTKLKNQELDVLTSIPTEDFLDFKKEGNIVNEHFNLYNIDRNVYLALGFNNKPGPERSPIFADKAARKAVSHLVDIEFLIESHYQGLANPAVGPTTPASGDAFNKDLKPVEFSPEKTLEILTEAGWEDTDGDGILDKMINGRKVPFSFTFDYSNSNEFMAKVANSLREEGDKVGIEVIPNELAFTKIRELSSKRAYDMIQVGIALPNLPPDYKESWHSESFASGGSNHYGFVNAKADSLIDLIRVVTDNKKRNELSWEVQELIKNEYPMVFLVTPQERIAIHKRLGNAMPFGARPNFSATSFWVKDPVEKTGTDKQEETASATH